MNQENLEQIRLVSIEKLKSSKLPFNESLPTLDSTTFRSLESIWPRILVLASLKSMVECPDDKAEILKWLAENELTKFLTKKELLVVNKAALKEQDIIDLSWYQESLYAMLWAVHIVTEMKFPTKESDVVNYLKFIPPDISIDQFLNDIKFREEIEILQQLDLYYNLHWIAKRSNTGLNASVIIERRKALEWVCDRKTEWDDMDLST